MEVVQSDHLPAGLFVPGCAYIGRLEILGGPEFDLHCCTSVVGGGAGRSQGLHNHRAPCMGNELPEDDDTASCVEKSPEVFHKEL